MNQAMKALLYAFKNSDFFSTIIIFSLIFISVYSFSLMIEKYSQVTKSFGLNNNFLTKFRESSNVLHLANQLERFIGAPIMEIYRSGMNETMEILDLSDRRIQECCQSKQFPRGLQEYELQRVRATMEREVADKIIALEAKMNTIATIVSLAPFMGLLGTVVGITITLCSAAMNGGRMDFSIVGPGICGALLTTVLGLLVAIPALVGSNVIIGKLRETTVGMENFIDDFITLLRGQSMEIEHTQKTQTQSSEAISLNGER